MDFTERILEDILPALYTQEGNENPLVYLIFVDRESNWTWYATEYSADERIFYGLVNGWEREWGYFSLRELQSLGARIKGIVLRDGKPIKELI